MAILMAVITIIFMISYTSSAEKVTLLIAFMCGWASVVSYITMQYNFDELSLFIKVATIVGSVIVDVSLGCLTYAFVNSMVLGTIETKVSRVLKDRKLSFDEASEKLTIIAYSMYNFFEPDDLFFIGRNNHERFMRLDEMFRKRLNY